MDKGAECYSRFLNGDESGLVEIIKDYKDGLTFYLNSFTGNIHIAEELAEEVFIKLFTRRPKDLKKCLFKTWLYTIGRNAAIDYLRSLHRRKRVSEEEYQRIQSDEKSLEQEYIKEEQNIALHRAMSKLKPEYSQVLWLVYFEDFSHKEAAAIMKKTPGGIDTLVYRAKQALKSELEKEGFNYEKL